MPYHSSAAAVAAVDLMLPDRDLRNRSECKFRRNDATQGRRHSRLRLRAINRTDCRGADIHAYGECFSPVPAGPQSLGSQSKHSMPAGGPRDRDRRLPVPRTRRQLVQDTVHDISSTASNGHIHGHPISTPGRRASELCGNPYGRHTTVQLCLELR